MPRALRPILLGAAAALAVIAVVVAGGVTAARTLFSPDAFVRSYLAALQRGDAAGALLLAGGTATPANGLLLSTDDDSLLASAALAPFTIDEIRDLGADTEGVHPIQVTWIADGTSHRTVLEVAPDDPRGLVFPGWRFAESPLASLVLVTRGDPRVDVNGARIEAPERSRFAVFVPGIYRVGHQSLYLEDEAAALVADTPGADIEGVVAPEPTERLRSDVAEAAATFLDGCVEQRLLFPTGCPFGREEDNRVLEGPEWSIVTYPDLDFSTTGSLWRASGQGTVHIRMRVQRIFDGGRNWVEEDVAFTLRLDVEIGTDDHLVVIPDDRLSLVR